VIVAVSKAVGDMFTGKAASKVRVIYNGTDTSRFSPAKDGTAVRREFNISGEELVIGVVGRLTQWKGQREFLKAASIISAHIPNTKFLIVGDTTFSDPGYKDELCRLADRTGLSSRVIFTGFRTDVPELVAAMDLCVLPSVLPDPCPLVLFDYMASEKPVVATKLGGAPEIIEHGKDGILTDPFWTDDFAGEMISLLKDAPARKRLAASARQKVVECFTLDIFVAQFQKLYLEVVH
jgi:glycosyltransferase involved in cell wall biosynthesis